MCEGSGFEVGRLLSDLSHRVSALEVRGSHGHISDCPACMEAVSIDGDALTESVIDAMAESAEEVLDAAEEIVEEIEEVAEASGEPEVAKAAEEAGEAIEEAEEAVEEIEEEAPAPVAPSRAHALTRPLIRRNSV